MDVAMICRQLRLRFPFRPRETGPDTPSHIEVILSMKFGGDLVLTPVRTTVRGTPSEFHVRVKDTKDHPYLSFHGYPRPNGVVLPEFKVTQPLSLTLGQLAAAEGPLPAFLLTGGRLMVDIRETDKPWWREHVKAMWPTGVYTDLTHARFEPGGVHLQGRLPAAFFPQSAEGAKPTEASRTVVLRLPQPVRRRTNDWPAAPADVATADIPHFRGCAEVTGRRFWTLTGYPFTVGPPGEKARQLPTAANLAEGWLQAISAFERPGRRAGSFIDARRDPPGENCEIAVFEFKDEKLDTDKPAQPVMRWVARNLNTKFTLGGAGSAEAEFAPARLYGAAADGWIIAAESIPPADVPAGGTNVSLSLSRNDDPDDPHDEDGLKIDQIAVAPITIPSGATAEGVRSWICMDSGWLAIDGRNLAAKIDPALVTEGPLSGVLELDVLLDALDRPVGADDVLTTSELGVTAQTLAGSRISIEFTNRPVKPGYRKLTLTLTDPMLTVVTPRVFASVASDAVLPTLTSTLSEKAKASDAEAADEVQKALELAIFAPAVFVSHNVLSAASVAASLNASLEFGEKEFVLGLPPKGLSLWERPPGLPLIRTYPLDSNQFPGSFLDANRPLLAHRAEGGGLLTLQFRRGRLPTLKEAARLGVDSNTGAVKPTAGWRVDLPAGRGGNPSYFLPTLPGLELTPAADGSLRWDYRHAVPVLDEAYAEASEERRDPTAPPAQPSTGELPPGFDPTRVSGTVAFSFGDTSALGWLPKSPANADGELALAGPAQPRLLGRDPEFSITLANPDGSASTGPLPFSRRSNPNGLSLPLAVTPPAAPGPVEKPEHFAVALGTGAAPAAPAFADDVIRDGHPLLATLDGENLVRSQDATGRIQVQGVDEISYSRSLGGAAAAERVSARIAPTENIVLTLAGVDRTDRPKSELDLQSWSLHGKSGEPARVLGFPLAKRALRKIAQAGAPAKWDVRIEVALGLLDAAVEDMPASARDPLPASEPGSALLTFTKPVAGGDWRLAKIEGELDWTFRAPASDPKDPVVGRIVAEFAETPAEITSLRLGVRRLELYLPTGPAVLDFSDANRPTATLANDKLTLAAFMFSTPNGLKVEVGEWVIDRAKLEASHDHRNPLPAAPKLESYRLVWSRSGQDWELQRALKMDGHDDGWSFNLKEKGAEFIRLPLEQSVRASADRWLFHTGVHAPDAGGAGAPAPAVKPAFPEGSWFDRSRADAGAVGAVFADPDRIEAITAEVLVHLKPRVAEGVAGEVTAQVSIAFGGAGATPPTQALLSGWLKLPNQITLHAEVDKKDKTASHSVTLFFDRTPWPFEALVHGTMTAKKPLVFSAAAEHRLEFGDGAVLLWQVVQPVRLLQEAVFEKEYLGPPDKPKKLKKKAGASGAPEDWEEAADGTDLAVDASWVFWIGEQTEPTPPQGGVAVRSPHLTSALWLSTRLADRGRLDRQKARLVRVPFGFTTPGVAFQFELRLVPGGTRVAIGGTGSQAGATAERLAAAEPVPDGIRFVERGSNARWLSADWLAGLFGPLDTVDGQLLPGYLNKQGKASTLLPRVRADERKGELDDWGWALERLPEAERRLPAAALRTPYIPLRAPVRLPGSNLVEGPFQIHIAPPPAPDAKRADAQLLGFIGGRLTLLRQATLDPAALKPRDWAIEVVRALRRDEATILLTDFATFEIIDRPFDPRNHNRPEWHESAIARPPAATDRPPPDEWDSASRSVADAAMSVLDPTYATVKPRRTTLTVGDAPDWIVYAASPQVAPPTVSKSAAATRFRLAQAGARRGRLSPALVTRAAPADLQRKRRTDANGKAEDGKPSVTVRPVQSGDLLGVTKVEDAPFEACEKPFDERPVYPSVGSAPYARRDGVPREWLDANGTPPIWTIAPPLLDVVAWARRPGELGRTRWSGHRIRYSENAGLLQCELAVSSGQAVTLRQPRATPGRFESVNLRSLFSRQLLGGRFQYSRLRLTQTITATPPPDPERLYAAICSQSEVFPSFEDLNIATSLPAVLRKKGSDGPLENFGFFLVADAGFAPALQTEANPPVVLARTVVFACPFPELPPGAQNSELPIDKPEALVVFGNNTDNDLEAPKPDSSWFEVGGDARAFDVLAALSEEQRNKLREKIRDGTLKAIIVARYTRAEASKPWQPPGRPLAVISVAVIDQGLELVKPKSTVTLLHAPTGAASEAYSAAGYARLDDDDFTPIRPGKPQGERTDRVEWSRIADLRSLDRVPSTRDDVPPDKPAASQFDYDVVFYGPGGELVPTKP
jgi:hypothetical protein